MPEFNIDPTKLPDFTDQIEVLETTLASLQTDAGDAAHTHEQIKRIQANLVELKHKQKTRGDYITGHSRRQIKAQYGKWAPGLWMDTKGVLRDRNGNAADASQATRRAEQRGHGPRARALVEAKREETSRMKDTNDAAIIANRRWPR